MNLIRRIGANTRYFSNFSAKILSDVAAGNAAAGMCIDYYGRTYDEQLQKVHGRSRVRFVTPEGGSSLSVDPIALLRGAPNRDLGVKFIEFVLSEEGQALWNTRVNVAGGPRRQALRRLPVRRDLYREPFLSRFSDPEVRPYDRASQFTYEPAWTARAFSAIRFIIKSMCVDAHEELQAAWTALITHGFPPEATAVFEDLTPVTYERALGEIADVLKRSKLDQSAYSRQLTQHFRDRYRRAARLAKAASQRDASTPGSDEAP
jgi:spermidine/putrescine-binding protein